MLQKTSLVGIAFMLINVVACAIQDLASKLLQEGGSLNSTHVIFFYKFILLIAILPWVFKDGTSVLRSKMKLYHILRSFCSVIGGICFYRGLHYIPLSDGTAIENIQYIFSVIIGVLFFKEKYTNTKAAAVIMSFLGAMMVTHPGFFFSHIKREFDYHYLYPFIGIVFWSLSVVIIKILGRTEENKTQVFYLLLFGTLWASLFAVIDWSDVQIFGLNIGIAPSGITNFFDIGLNWYHIKFLILMAACYYIHSIAIFKALKFDLSVVEPFRYSKLIFAGLLGFYIFDEIPQPENWLGYLLIAISGFLIGRYEYRKHKSKRKHLKT